MDRRALLRNLIDERFGGNVAAFARAIKKSPSQVHQWLSGHRSLGDAGARHIERTIPGLWLGYFDGEKKPAWLDHDHAAQGGAVEAGSIDELINLATPRSRETLERIRQRVIDGTLDDDDLAVLGAMADRLAENKQKK